MDNEHAPTSSAEEAAALLGAALSFDASQFSSSSSNNNNNSKSSSNSSSNNPPQGMHSIFTVQTPVPNQLLFIRLVNLRAWLRWHAGITDDLGITLRQQQKKKSSNNGDGGGGGSKQQQQPPFQAARSILAVLQKLLEISSTMAAEGGFGASLSSSTNVEDNAMMIAALSPKYFPKKSLQSGSSSSNTAQPGHHNQQNHQHQQHRAIPPLLSTPIRQAWVECTALCLHLGSTLPGNLRTDIHSLITKMIEISNWNPRSKMASGGVRLSALMVLGKICIVDDKIDNAASPLCKRVSPYAYEILQCCHKGLLSGGAGEPGHRVECVQTAWRLALACRRSYDDVNNSVSTSFLATGAMEDRAIIEAIKFIKRAVTDKYPEVRMGAAVFAGIVAPMLIRNLPRGVGGIGGGGGGIGGGGKKEVEILQQQHLLHWFGWRMLHRLQ